MRFLELSRNQHIELGHNEITTVYLHLHLLIVGTHHHELRECIILIGLCRQRDTLAVKGLFLICLYPTIFRLHHPNLALDQMSTAKLEVIQGIFILWIQLQRHLIYIKGIVILVLRQKAVAHVVNGIRLQFGIRRHLYYFLELVVGCVVGLFGIIHIAQIELSLRIVRPDFQGFSIICNGLLVVPVFIVTVASSNGLLVTLCRNRQRRRQENYDGQIFNELIHLSFQKC